MPHAFAEAFHVDIDQSLIDNGIIFFRPRRHRAEMGGATQLDSLPVVDTLLRFSLLFHQSDMTRNVAPFQRLHRLPIQHHIAGLWLSQTGKQRHEAGLAGAVGSDDTEKFALHDINAHALDDIDAAVAKDMARRAAREEGMLVGISSGATLAAILRKLPDLPDNARVLGFNYDTGERYLSVPDFLPEQ